mmetsp:Transcript_10712/g.17961  ORF Transcript_10712/g.17961 Transcript_10712/m.17961 type:complete len:316 (+) Transcript_10712:232-1179(+)
MDQTTGPSEYYDQFYPGWLNDLIFAPKPGAVEGKSYRFSSWAETGLGYQNALGDFQPATSPCDKNDASCMSACKDTMEMYKANTVAVSKFRESCCPIAATANYSKQMPIAEACTAECGKYFYGDGTAPLPACPRPSRGGGEPGSSCATWGDCLPGLECAGGYKIMGPLWETTYGTEFKTWPPKKSEWLDEYTNLDDIIPNWDEFFKPDFSQGGKAPGKCKAASPMVRCGHGSTDTQCMHCSGSDPGRCESQDCQWNPRGPENQKCEPVTPKVPSAVGQPCASDADCVESSCICEYSSRKVLFSSAPEACKCSKLM